MRTVQLVRVGPRWGKHGLPIPTLIPIPYPHSLSLPPSPLPCVQDLILRGEFVFEADAWEGFSNAARHLVCGLLTVDPVRRLTMTQALQHPWFTGVGADRLPPVPAAPTHNQAEWNTPAARRRRSSAVASVSGALSARRDRRGSTASAGGFGRLRSGSELALARRRRSSSVAGRRRSVAPPSARSVGGLGGGSGWPAAPRVPTMRGGSMRGFAPGGLPVEHTESTLGTSRTDRGGGGDGGHRGSGAGRSAADEVTMLPYSPLSVRGVCACPFGAESCGRGWGGVCLVCVGGGGEGGAPCEPEKVGVAPCRHTLPCCWGHPGARTGCLLLA
jgi:hypothetical protein